jgi:membrane-associated protein
MKLNLISRRTRRIGGVILAIFALSTALFATRSYHSFLLLQSAYAVGAPATSSIRPWMTLGYVAKSYGASERDLRERLALAAETEAGTSLKSLADRAGIAPSDYVKEVQRAVAELRHSNGAAPDAAASGWLGDVGEEVLTALLVYGYPVLGLMLTFGAIGVPLPDGIAMAVVGSLAAQGRMDVSAAITVAVLASILGDAIGYGLGRLLGREVLERRGRWIGYTRERGARVQALFEQWGALTIFLTRTFVSYLSSAASLLAGVGRYDLTKFLAISAAGRVLWAAAYLGLGYATGGDLEAAASFLANVSGLLLSLLVLVATTLLMFVSRRRAATMPMSI